MNNKSSYIISAFLLLSLQACHSDTLKLNEGKLTEEHTPNEPIESETPQVKETTNEPTLLLQDHVAEAHYCQGNELFLYINDAGDEVYLYNLETKEKDVIIKASGLKNNVSWSKDCSSIIYAYKENYKRKYNQVNIGAIGKTVEVNYPPLTSMASLAYSDTVFYLDNKTLQIRASYNGKSWPITQDENRYYNVLISPNGKFLAANKESDIVVINLTDNTKINLGRGIHTAWHSSNNYLIGYLDESNDGHAINNSDIYLYDINNKEVTKITESNNLYESNPIFINDNTISFTDLNHSGLYSLDISTYIK